ncbi:MAG: amidohydrolase family protein [Geminicoccaceae bacterium]
MADQARGAGRAWRRLFEWQPADVEPYVLHLLDCFGPERLMFASNWPVSNLHSTYARWWEALQAILDRQGLSADERRHLFETTAVRAYRLPP